MTYTEFSVIAQTKYFHVGNAEMYGYLDQARMVWYKYCLSLGFEAVVVHVSIDFKKEVFHLDQLYIRTVLDRIGNTSFALKQTVENDQKEHLASAEIILTTLNRDTRTKITVPSTIHELLNKDRVLEYSCSKL